MTALPEPANGLAHERELDVKLVNAAIEKRARVEADRLAGKPTPLERMAVLRQFRSTETPSDQATDRPARLTPEEGEQFDAPEAIRVTLVPPRFTAATFANYRPKTESQELARASVAQWVDMAIAGEGPMLALIGEQGTGKSHLLYAAVNVLLAQRRDCYARPWYRLADELRYGGPSASAPRLHDEPHEVRARLWKHRIVFLDEVRPTASTAFDDTELAKYACHAYDNENAVLVTTNVAPLSAVMGAPAASRFTQLVIEGPDWRQDG